MKTQLSKWKVNNGQFILHTKHNLKTPLGNTLGTSWELEREHVGWEQRKNEKINKNPLPWKILAH
jgi:hypothetical protein